MKVENRTADKREPLLADKILSGSMHYGAVKSSWCDRVIDTLLTAKRFVLDSQAAVYLAQMIRDNPRIIADAQDFAIPPFERMWIEFPFEAFFTTLTGRFLDSTGDTRVGYLFDGPVVRCASASR